MELLLSTQVEDIKGFIVHLVIAALLGGVIGLERQWTRHQAGILTNLIVCLGSYSFTAFGYLVSDGNVDLTRIAAQVVSGIGFLGAGIIMYRRDVMHGLTTAAGVWATAAIGMALGAGFVVTGVCATAIIVVLQLVFHLPVKAFTTRHISVIRMLVWLETDDILDKITDKLGSKKISSYKVKQADGKMIASVEVSTTDEFSVAKLNEVIRAYPEHVMSIERVDE